MKAQYEELKEQTRRLEQEEYGGNRVRGDDKENSGSLESVQERCLWILHFIYIS